MIRQTWAFLGELSRKNNNHIFEADEQAIKMQRLHSVVRKEFVDLGVGQIRLLLADFDENTDGFVGWSHAKVFSETQKWSVREPLQFTGFAEILKQGCRRSDLEPVRQRAPISRSVDVEPESKGHLIREHHTK